METGQGDRQSTAETYTQLDQTAELIDGSEEAIGRAGRFIGLAFLVLVLFSVGGLVIPAILSARASARRTACLENLKQLGLAFEGHVIAHRRYPSSCHVKKDGQGQVMSMDGFSWIADLLPYMEYQSLYDTLDMPDGSPTRHLGDPTHPHTIAMGRSIPVLQCPAFGGSAFVDPATEAEAITNYKASGATHLESLSIASPKPMQPKYGELIDHPDGAIYPGSTHGVDGFKNDGLLHTILVVESVEQNVARWTVGAETCVVMLPPVVEFCERPKYRYYHVTGFTPNAFYDQSTIPPEINKTYLEWDYDANPYEDGGVSLTASTPIRYGPSSHHPGVTHHLYACGNVAAISNDVDAMAYMIRTTRNNGDPLPNYLGMEPPCLPGFTDSRSDSHQ